PVTSTRMKCSWARSAGRLDRRRRNEGIAAEDPARSRGRGVIEARGQAPPPGALEGRVRGERCPMGQVTKVTRELGGAREAGADVEGAGLVAAGLAGDHAVPVEGAKERPGGDGADVDAELATLTRGGPQLVEPPDLLVGGAAEVDLGDDDRE